MNHFSVDICHTLSDNTKLNNLDNLTLRYAHDKVIFHCIILYFLAGL